MAYQLYKEQKTIQGSLAFFVFHKLKFERSIDGELTCAGMCFLPTTHECATNQAPKVIDGNLSPQ